MAGEVSISFLVVSRMSCFDLRRRHMMGHLYSPIHQLTCTIFLSNVAALKGRVMGGRILGEYPSDLTEKSQLNLGRGRIQPTTSWEALWNGIAQWFGITDENDLDVVLPYRKYLSDNDKIYSESDLFVDSDLNEQDQQCSPDALAQLCGLEEDTRATNNLKRTRRMSEENVKDSASFSTNDTSYLLHLSLIGCVIGTGLAILFARQRK